MDFTQLSNIFTVLSFVTFIGIALWAYSGKNKARFEKIGRMEMDNDTEMTGTNHG